MTDLERARDELRKARTLLARWQGVHAANVIIARVNKSVPGSFGGPDPTESEVDLNRQTEEYLANWQAGLVSGK